MQCCECFCSELQRRSAPQIPLALAAKSHINMYIFMHKMSFKEIIKKTLELFRLTKCLSVICGFFSVKAERQKQKGSKQ